MRPFEWHADENHGQEGRAGVDTTAKVRSLARRADLADGYSYPLVGPAPCHAVELMTRLGGASSRQRSGAMTAAGDDVTLHRYSCRTLLSSDPGMFGRSPHVHESRPGDKVWSSTPRVAGRAGQTSIHRDSSDLELPPVR